MSNDSHKHLNNERLSQKQNKTYFADVTFSESCMGTPDNLQNFKFLKSRVYEIWGGGAQLPLITVRGLVTKNLSIGRVNIILPFWMTFIVQRSSKMNSVP